MNNPISYYDQSLVNYFNLQPSQVKGQANSVTQYYKRMLWTKIYSVFKFTLPKDWKLNFFRYWLFQYGSIGVIYTKKFGWVAQPYSIIKRDLYYNPKQIQVYNQFIDTPKVGVVGVNAGIINVMDDYYGLDSIVSKYAEMLAQVDKSLNINLMNCNVALLAEVESKKEAEEVKEAYADATEGKPLVTMNKDILKGRELKTMFGNVRSNFIAIDLITVRRGIMNAFLTEIGIKNANQEKRERLNSDEVSENNDETRAIISVIYDNIKKSMDEINVISGLNLGVSLRYDYINKEVAQWEE